MRLILKQYLNSLRERGELDAILPDLLSQMGLIVYSRPGRGTRQDGVDIGAVGSLDGGPKKVYLFSVKAGNLTRENWDGGRVQSLRPSLNEILDSYIPHRLPAEHRKKDIVICIVIGGDVQEQVSSQLTGFITRNTTDNITFEEWNGDKLASLIQSNFLREDLLPDCARSLFRKSLALLDEPAVSYKHFSALVKSLSADDTLRDVERIMALRQMSICLWILFVWAREAGNLEAAYLSSEFTLLHGWNTFRLYSGKKGKTAQAIKTTFFSIFSVYRQICSQFLWTNVLPHVGKFHALSSEVRTPSRLDINLKLFDLLGRLATEGIWTYWDAECCYNNEAELKQQVQQVFIYLSSAIKKLILNNPILFLPAKDDQAIDIFIAALLLALDKNNYDYLRQWFAQILERAYFAWQTHSYYPCNLLSYSDLLAHPISRDDEYRKRVTGGSILYPIIALWAALLDDEEIYNKVSNFKLNHLQHCNFQLWYPDECSEAHFYTNNDSHGAILSDVCVDRPKEDLLSQVFGECDQSPYYKELSAVKFSFWPLIVVACRHYRLPLPLHLLEMFRKS